MMAMKLNKEDLFIKTLQDIESRINNNGQYEVLMISGLLRKLFFDDFPLVDQINEDFHLKLKFEIVLPRDYKSLIDDSSLHFWSAQDCNPENAPPGIKSICLNRDKFFKTVILKFAEKKWSIHDIIIFEANIAGGIHVGIAKDDRDRALAEVGRVVSCGGVSPALRQLISISKIVLKTLIPLTDKINGRISN